MSKNNNLRPAVFIDRDGTLNKVLYDKEGREESPFRPEDLVLLPGAGEFTRKVREAGYLAVLATNQPGVAKGKVTIAGLDRVHQHLLELLAQDGGGLDEICYCPHHPVGVAGVPPDFVRVCECRKPAPGMLVKAAGELEIDLARSWMVGDKWLDVKAGQAAGCRTILLPAPAVTTTPPSPDPVEPTAFANNLHEALRIILGKS